MVIFFYRRLLRSGPFPLYDEGWTMERWMRRCVSQISVENESARISSQRHSALAVIAMSPTGGNVVFSCGGFPAKNFEHCHWVSGVRLKETLQFILQYSNIVYYPLSQFGNLLACHNFPVAFFQLQEVLLILTVCQAYAALSSQGWGWVEFGKFLTFQEIFFSNYTDLKKVV